MPAIIPSQIKIGNRTVPIDFVSNLDIKGFYDPSEFVIGISDDLSPMDTVETFWHELVHAIFDYIRFGLEVAMEIDDKDSVEEDAFKIEERTAESFAKIFLQVLQDNELTELTQ